MGNGSSQKRRFRDLARCGTMHPFPAQGHAASTMPKTAKQAASPRQGRQWLRWLACGGLMLLAPPSPAFAEWQCTLERSYTCDGANDCRPVDGAGIVTLSDDLPRYKRCGVECIEGEVIIRRNFFGSTYKDVQGELPGLTAVRSRSGEYSESTFARDGKLTSLAFGTCLWK